jgi:hypothetical protein
MVGTIVRQLKEGEEARLPGVGAFSFDKTGQVTFEPERKRRA